MRLKLAISLILVLAATASAQDISQFDLSTDDGINAAREAIAGKKLDDRSKRCIHRNQSLPGLVVVGSFAFDYGCRLQGAFIKSRYVPAGGDLKEISRVALNALGWKAANPKERETLAQAWVVKGLLGFLTVVSAKPKNFTGPSFQPPRVTTKTDGTTVVTVWVGLPMGRAREKTYQLREYVFWTDGTFLGSRTLDLVTAPRN